MELSFREKGIPKNLVKRILLLIIIFFAGLVFFNIIINFHPKSDVSKMSSPTLPTISMSASGTDLNELHGYKNEMDACFMRDDIVPLSLDRKLPIKIKTYGAKISNVSYEIYSLDTERKIAESKISDLSKDGGDSVSAEPVLSNLIDTGQEYILVLKLKADSNDLFYYTRITIPQDYHENECLEFAKYFHNTSLAENYADLATYIEPDGSSSDLSHVTINSNLNLVGWQGFSGSSAGDPVYSYKEINTSYSSIGINFRMQDSEGSYYNVYEYYRIRYSPDRMYLLSYDRKCEKTLSTSNTSLDSNLLNIGLSSSNIPLISNETGQVAAFVQGGELYEYDQTKGTLSKIFSFITGDNTDPREYYSEHNIKLLSIDETGTLDFAVYGYMNDGPHEGYCGIDVFHYDSKTGNTNEQAFINSTKSYRVLNANFSELIYQSAVGNLYILLDGTLFRINLNTMMSEEMYADLKSSEYAVSGSGRYVAISDSEKANKIKIIDLDDESEITVSAGKDESLIPLYFMEDDLAYGTAKNSDVIIDAGGDKTLPMYKIDIVSISGHKTSNQMTYQKSGIYITNVEKQETALELTRVTKSGDGFAPAEADAIKSSSGETNRVVTLKTDEDGNSVIAMAALSKDETVTLNFKTAGLTLLNKNNTINIDSKSTIEEYYVYVGNDVILATADVSTALSSAEENSGIVLDSSQQIVWKNTKSAAAYLRKEISESSSSSNIGKCLSSMLAYEDENVDVDVYLNEGESIIKILSGALKDDKVLNLSGCALSQVLYYVNLGTPVYASTGTDSAVLITGYDSATVTIYDPAGGTQKLSLEDAQAAFSNAGNIYAGYIRSK